MDCSSGDAVHIDFSCLFDKGLTLAQPEMVPFRLTHNVIDAFGVAGALRQRTPIGAARGVRVAILCLCRRAQRCVQPRPACCLR